MTEGGQKSLSLEERHAKGTHGKLRQGMRNPSLHIGAAWKKLRTLQEVKGSSETQVKRDGGDASTGTGFPADLEAGHRAAIRGQHHARINSCRRYETVSCTSHLLTHKPRRQTWGASLGLNEGVRVVQGYLSLAEGVQDEGTNDALSSQATSVGQGLELPDHWNVRG